jgi:ribosomal protein L37AE/L43A
MKSKNWASQTNHVLESQGDKRHLNDIIYNKVCPQCNASFTAKKTNTIFCSQRCGKLYRKTQKDLKEGLKKAYKGKFIRENISDYLDTIPTKKSSREYLTVD